MKLTPELLEIRKNALAIAKFEGFVVNETTRYGKIFYSDDNERTAIDTGYHNETRWLKPVVEKIDKFLLDNIGIIGYSDDCLYSDDIEIQYQAVIEFLNWYNELQ